MAEGTPLLQDGGMQGSAQILGTPSASSQPRKQKASSPTGEAGAKAQRQQLPETVRGETPAPPFS